ncbi:PTS sugar transporter subunit IIA [Brachyspira hampsonii]|uniref:PTS system fructose subfamily transporter subunit IIC subunit n=1 Tax=Brachyspira hampsonii 30446 TaxID=1289135 RepID=A0A2U4F108_9SPIR|nr:PTS sugar transporter subunit IIA [Brachyspira hampsonii]EKV55927.1 PTS system fructose subfamily transporter subunit IIC subunit [Brachyspira hampsonii 30446]MBW5389861.1 PTS sugar transporter subunit IIA [Brachyspira hampsonii]MBW5394274.1 PTS sugar transporter subunit IIA [Brachyspira hampsonii]OEJ19700.1 PTS fructose transporter subunit IIA [Brachyspira hampsonii]PTY40095.1 PTS fructose transporter subunit IIA [Brachyspira hampsonii bv. II]
MSLIDYINKDSIMIDVQETDKERLLSKMVERLDECKLLINKNDAEHAIMAREQLMSTGVGNGIAIPHAKTDAVENIVLSVATIKNGINYKSVDKKKVFAVFMLLAPKTSASENLKVLTAIAKILRDNPHFLEKLINVEKPEEIMELIAKEEMKI